MTWYLGVDPGEHGGAALVHSSGKLLKDRDGLIRCCDFKKNSEHDIARWFDFEVGILNHGLRAALEKVWSSPQMGVASAFAFGWNYGLARTLLVCNKITFEEPIPRRWQKDLAIRPRGKKEGQPDFKKRLRARAQELWPQYAEQITPAIADALLIAEWLRRQENNSAKARK
jgi:hypothetical protein